MSKAAHKLLKLGVESDSDQCLFLTMLLIFSGNIEGNEQIAGSIYSGRIVVIRFLKRDFTKSFLLSKGPNSWRNFSEEVYYLSFDFKLSIKSESNKDQVF